MIPQVGDKFKHMFENMLQMSVGGGIVFLSNKVLNRRGRLARTLVVLSLAIVMVATFAFSAGAGSTDSMAANPDSFVSVVVGPGETLWSLAGRMAGDGDVRSLIEEIMIVNSLATPDVQAGQTLRIPLHS